MPIDKEKFIINPMTYRVTCLGCEQVFDGRTDAYETHVCHATDQTPMETTPRPNLAASGWRSSPLPVVATTSGKTPHKCPICEGIGRVPTLMAKIDFDNTLFDGKPMNEPCPTCHGDRILWG